MKKIFMLMAAVLFAAGVMAECQDGPYGLQINGTKVVDAPKYGDPDYQGRVQYKASCVELAAGDIVKLINQSCGDTWMVDLDPYGEYQSFEGGATAGQLTCKKAGQYDFYIKLSMEVGDILYVGPAESCGEPAYDGAAPAQCPDVMLQAFYWDSYQNKTDKDSKTSVYGRTKWVDHLNGANGTSATEIGQWFDLVWLPPMSKSSGGTGYHPVNYGVLDCDWGTKTKLTELISVLHQNGARVVADIVINHADAQEGWCNFKSYTFGNYGTFTPDGSYICNTDEMNTSAPTTECRGYATGNADDGYGDEANYAASRDWDHKNPEVQAMFKAYLQWLCNDIKIDGFRYDYCKGFDNGHINDYNKTAKPYFSVMEMWDGNTETLKWHIGAAGNNTTTFDFAMKYTAFNNGIASDNYCSLKGAGLPGAGMARYAVTFLDSHDSFLRDGNEFCGEGNSMTVCYDKIMQCYAYMLSMPGVPCVFYPHWVTFKDAIKPIINARYKTGVHSESSVSDECGNGYYKATITGKNGEIRLLVGPNSGYDSTPSGYTLAGKGVNYGVYYKTTSACADKDKERQPIPEGIEDVQGNNVQSAKGVKFMQNGQLFIRVGETTYDAQGRIVK